MALPSIISNITVPLLGIVDVAIVGHIGNEDYIAAIAIGSMIFNVAYWLFGFLRMGTSGFTSQAFGARNRQATTYVLVKMMLIAVAVATAMVVLQLPLRSVAFALMGVGDAIYPLVATYFNIVVWGAPATLGLYVLTGWFIGMQNTRIPMWISIIQNIINIAASATMVFVFGLGIAGVAFGTMLAQWSGFAMAVLAMRNNFGEEWKTMFESGLSRHPQAELFTTSFFAANRDIFLRTLCLVAVNMFFTAAGSRQGSLMLSVNTLLMTFFTLFSYVMDGFAYAGEALAGKYYGTRDMASLRVIVQRLLNWGIMMSMVFALTYHLAGNTILGLLTDKQPVIVAAAEYRFWAVLVPVTGMLAFVFDGIFVGITATRHMLLSCFGGAVAFFAIFFLFTKDNPNHILWLSLNIYLAIRGAILAVVFYRTTLRKA